MSQYDNTNRGALFDNERKETDNHPDMTGTLNINGVDHWFSGWWKTTRSGDEFLSLSIGKPKTAQQESQPAPRRSGKPEQRAQEQRAPKAPAKAASGWDDMDSEEIPF